MNVTEILTILQKFLTLLDPTLTLADMLGTVAYQLVDMFKVDHSGVLMFNEDDIEGTVIAEYPLEGAVMLKVPLTDYPLVEQLKTKLKPIAVFDAQNDPIMGNARMGMKVLGIQSILIIPLIVKDKIIGSLSLDSINTPRQFSQAGIDLCSIIGHQIGVAVDYANALAASETNHRQAQTLREVNRALGESLDLDEILTIILAQLEKVIPINGSSIYLLSENLVQMKAWRGKYNPFVNNSFIPLSSLWGSATIINTKKPILIPDTFNDPDWDVYEGSLIRSWLGVPLIFRDKVVGLLYMDGYQPGQFKQAQIETAQIFANHAALAIHNAHLYGQATRRAELLASVQEIGSRITASLNIKDVLETIITNVISLVASNHARIYLYDAKTDHFTLAAVPDNANNLVFEVSPPRQEGLTARVARSGQYILVSNAFEHPFYENKEGLHGFGAIIGIPLKKQDTVLGVLNVFYQQAHHFQQDEIDLLHLLAIQAAVAIENARLYQVEVKQIEQELEIARKIQRGFLPKTIPSIAGWHIAAICVQARETGGDFYEFIKRSDDIVGIIIGDVSGKSIQAAMLMAASQSLTQAKGSDYLSPADVLKESNALLYDDVPKGAFVALSYATLAPNSNTVYLSSGGQLAPFLVPANNSPIQLIETPGDRLPLGIIPHISYQNVSFRMEPSDILVFHTDGLVECQNTQREMLGFKKVTTLLNTLRGQPPDAILKALLQTVEEFTQGADPHDDITLVVIQRQKNNG